MTKLITSKKTKKEQFISDEDWQRAIEKGWASRFTVRDVFETRLSKPPIIMPAKPKVSTEIKVIKKKTKK
jgi:hypothetical protein